MLKFDFHLTDFPNTDFQLETSIWTGRSKLLMDNYELERSDESGRPYLIPSPSGEMVKAFPKRSLPDFIPILEINGNSYQIGEKLNWFQYVIGGLPILLMFVGGLIGGAVGGGAVMINFNIFRQKGNAISKYLKVSGVVIGSYIFHYLIVNLLIKILN